MTEISHEISSAKLSVDPLTISRLRRLLSVAIKNCHSEIDLSEHLAGFGYGLEEHDGVAVLTTLPHGKPLCRAANVGIPSILPT